MNEIRAKRTPGIMIAVLALFRRYANLFMLWVLIASAVVWKRPATFAFVLPHIPLALGLIMFGMGTTIRRDAELGTGRGAGRAPSARGRGAAGGAVQCVAQRLGAGAGELVASEGRW
jgi:hypothetical protein